MGLSSGKGGETAGREVKGRIVKQDKWVLGSPPGYWLERAPTMHLAEVLGSHLRLHHMLVPDMGGPTLQRVGAKGTAFPREKQTPACHPLPLPPPLAASPPWKTEAGAVCSDSNPQHGSFQCKITNEI